MKRDFIVVVGGQGCGKSVWGKQLTAPTTRLITFDPTRSFSVNYDWDETEGERILSGAQKNFRIGTDDPEELSTLCDIAYVVGDCTVLVEEAGVLFGKRQALAPSVRRVIFMGRHRRVNLILLAQRSVSIPVDLRSQANRFVCFRQIEEQDVSAACGILGREYRHTIPALPELHCIDWHHGEISRYALTIKNGSDSLISTRADGTQFANTTENINEE